MLGVAFGVGRDWSSLCLQVRRNILIETLVERLLSEWWLTTASIILSPSVDK